MRDKLKGAVIAAVVIAALAVGGAAIAGAAGGGGDDNSKAITGSALDRAKAVALQHTGGGKVTATEAGDEEGAYEVEVTQADGSQVDVHLDKDFKVLNSAADREHGDHQDAGGDHESGHQD